MRKPTAEVTKVARLIREALTRQFPGTKFRVIPHKVGIHININWAKGPTYEMVKEITHRYESRIKYIVHARSYGNGTDPNAHEDFVERVARDICTITNQEYTFRWSKPTALRILSNKDLTDGYNGICKADLV